MPCHNLFAGPLCYHLQVMFLLRLLASCALAQASQQAGLPSLES